MQRTNELTAVGGDQDQLLDVELEDVLGTGCLTTFSFIAKADQNPANNTQSLRTCEMR